jgi:acyl phosphate:glycerol-3-phosphate acyltransferase
VTGLWTVVGFLLGAIPFSVWLGRRVLHRDPRQYGDGNPGGTNVIRAGNRGLGALVIFLDMLKGALPVALAHYVFRVDGWPLLPVIVAPILGHAFSPFLRFRGGKAVAVTFGAWSSLTVPFGPFAMALPLVAANKVQGNPGWSVMAAWLVWLAFLLLTSATAPLVGAWAATLLILAWTHRADLVQAPRRRTASKHQDGA